MPLYGTDRLPGLRHFVGRPEDKAFQVSDPGQGRHKFRSLWFYLVLVNCLDNVIVEKDELVKVGQQLHAVWDSLGEGHRQKIVLGSETASLETQRLNVLPPVPLGSNSPEILCLLGLVHPEWDSITEAGCVVGRGVNKSGITVLHCVKGGECRAHRYIAPTYPSLNRRR